MSATGIVIGIDGGGSTTRALCADLTGTALAYAQTGGSNPEHNADAQTQMQTAIRAATAQAGRRFEDVVCLVAGIAGLNEPMDQLWATQHTAVPGLGCPRIHLNDAEVAHAGAFGTQPGIIAIAGTGSTIFAITDAGQHVQNGAFQHYAGAARHLAFDVVQRVLVGEACDDDAALVESLLRYWCVSSISELRTLMIDHEAQDYNAIKRAYGEMAVLVTTAAIASPLARAACARAVGNLALGICLLGKCFLGSQVRVVLIGGLARSPAICEPLGVMLAARPEKRYTMIDPVLSPVAGAILLALAHSGETIDSALTGRLGASIAALDSGIRITAPSS